MDARCIPLLLLACFVTYSRNSDIPKFGQSINNLTVPIGREAVLSCVVDDLNTYKVAWLRVDTQTILTIHSHVITKNHRIAVTHSDRRTWYLHIREVQETDRGFYMCQINTDPMKSQIGYLDVVVPPDILDYPTSADMVVREGSNVTLKCAASGSPNPRITWRKEGGELIALNNGQEVSTAEGSMLNISRVNRLHMGAYLCIASNGIPPTVSKRIMLIVHFPPMIWIQNQLVGAQIGQSVTLECHSEAYPKSINYWTRENGDIISQGTKYDTEFVDNAYKILMKLTIKSVSASDIITYRCISKNSLGDTDGTIKLYEIPPPTTVPRTTTTPITTTTHVPEHRGTENKKKVLKPKQESNINNVNNIRITDKSIKSEFTEQRKTSKIANVESGHARTVLHSSSNSPSCTSNHFTTFTTFTTCLILSQHLLSHLKCLC